jgi:serine-type D-Ala-D-Ala carboxypeptidase (penicillin-binding protein 5/6)
MKNYIWINVIGLLASTSALAYETPAKALYVVHPESGTVLANVNADTKMGPASLTKMMTLLLVFNALQDGKYTLETLVPVSEKAWRTGGSKMFIEVGTQVPLQDLIRGIAIVSGNDACVAVAEFMGGTEEGFASLMNAKARELGMAGSNFVNASGLPDPNQYTTAHDMAVVLTAIFKNFPDYKHFMAEEEFMFGGIKQQNRNGLLKAGLGIDAGKTGHTEESGYHLASTAVQNNERLVAVVMGTDGFSMREGEALRAYRTFFSTYQALTPFKPGDEVVANVPVWHGQVATTALTVAEPLKAFINKAEADGLKLTVSYTTPIVAPAAADKPVGEAVLTLPNGAKITTALVPLRPLEQGSFISRFVQTLANTLGL